MAGSSKKITKAQKTQAVQKLYEADKLYMSEYPDQQILKLVDEALELDHTNSRAHVIKFIMVKFITSKDAPDYDSTMAEAAKHLEIALKYNKNNLLAKGYQLTYRDPEVGPATIKEFKKIVKAKAKTADDFYAQVGALKRIHAGDDEAIKKATLSLLKKAISNKKFQDDVIVNYNYALELTYYEDTRTDKALGLFKKVVELEPSLAGIHAKISAILVSMERYEESIAPIKKAVELDPQNVEFHFDLGMAYSRYSDELWREGKEAEKTRMLKESEDELNVVLAIEPRNIAAIGSLGSVYNKAERFDEAVAMFNRALDIDSTDSYSLHGLARAYNHQGQPQLALEYYELAIEQSPEEVLYICNYANLLSAQGRSKEALVQIKKAQAIVAEKGYGDDLNIGNREHIEMVFTETKAELLGVLSQMGEDIAELAVGGDSGEDSLQGMLASFINKNILGATKAKWDAISAGLKAIGSAGDATTKVQVERLIQQKEALDRLREQKLNAEQIQAELTTLETKDPDAYEYCFGFSKTLIRAYSNATTAAGGDIAIKLGNAVSTFSDLATLIPFGGDIIAAGLKKFSDDRQEAQITSRLLKLEQVTLIPGEFNNIAARIALKVTYAKQSHIDGYKPKVKTAFDKFCSSIGKLGKMLAGNYDTDSFKGDLQKLGNVDALPLLKELYKGDEGGVKTRPSHEFEERATQWCMEHSPSSRDGSLEVEVVHFFESSLAGCDAALSAYVG